MSNKKQQPQQQAMQRRETGPVDTVRAMLGKMAPQIEAALPKQQGMDAGRFARIAMTCLQNNRGLQECTPISFISAVMQCAQLGLEPDSVIKLVHLVPFKNNGVKEVKIILDYRGIIRLALRSGEISDIQGVVVYSKDDFDHAYGTDKFIKHKRSLAADRGQRIAAYAVAYYRDPKRRPAQIILSPSEVDKRKASSRSSSRSDNPWQVHTDSMWRKSAVRALENQLPLDPIAQRAFVMDALGDRDQRQFNLMQGPGTVTVDYTHGGELGGLSDLTNRLEAGEQPETEA